MKKISLMLGVAFLTMTANAFATDQFLASSEVAVKNPVMHLFTQSNSAAISMEVDNNSGAPQVIVAANSPAAQETQLHKTMMEHGEATMRQIKQIVVAPRADKELRANGFHVMLLGLRKTLNPGDKVPVTLIFSDGSSLNINVNVG